MRRNLPLFLRSVLASVCMLLGFASKANHIAGMQLYYEYIGSNTYRVYVVAIGDCGVTSPALSTSTPRICLFNGNTLLRSKTFAAFGAGTEITPVCASSLTTCSGGTIPGYRKYITSDTFQLTGTSPVFRFVFNGYLGPSTSAGRVTTLANITTGSNIIRLCDTLNNTLGNNSSPVITSPFTPFFCQSNIDNFNPGAIDADGDNLNYSLIQGLKAGATASDCNTADGGGTYTYVAGFSAANPLGSHASSWTFDPATGQITFVPSFTNNYVIDYNIREFRGGTFIGNSMLEVNFIIQTCTTAPPSGYFSSMSGSGSIVDSTHFQVCQNAGAYNINIPGSSPGGFNVTMSASGLPAGSAFGIVSNGTPNPVGTFSWTSAVAPGTYTFYVQYTDNQCPVNGTNTQAFTVTILPPAVISGMTTICQGSTSSLSASVPGGTWSTTWLATLSVGASSGVVTGLSVGTGIITYTGPYSCSDTAMILVNLSPAPIAGTLSVCEGSTTTLTNSVAGGTWMSNDPTVASIGLSSGIATGNTAGTTTISYTLTNGCASTATLTVNATPPGITGTATVCVGQTTTLSNALVGGTWSSSNVVVASVGLTTGVVSGNAAGTATITYATGAGCRAIRVVTVNSSPAAINPTTPTTICVGSSVTLTDATPAGTWSSSNTSVAIITAGGVATGVGVGTATISYILSATGCYAIKTVTVNTAPSAITPASSAICVGNTTTLTNSVVGGTWTSSSTTVATVGASTGIVTAVGVGVANITYAIGTCTVAATVTVNPIPAAINPTTPTTLCVGNVVTFTDGTPGGTWISGTPSVATAGLTTGVINAVAAGTANITYTIGATGCFITKTVTVNIAPSAITPASSTVCVGSTVTLTNSVTGGTWASSNTAVATVGSSTGIVTGVAAGNVNITYAIGTCTVSATVTVNPLPAAITGTGTVCVGSTTTLADLTIGGTWSSSNAAIATVGSSSGIVTGVLSGTATISYILPTGCYTTTVVTVNSVPAAITGTATVCTGATTTLTDATTGGIWSSSNTAVATVGVTTGVVSGVSAGTAIISYSLGTGCSASIVVTVNASPAAIAGTLTLCAATTTSLNDATPGGTWSSSNTAVATVGATTGVVTGVAGGTATISYMLASGCYATATVSVNALATAGTISGPNTLCEGAFTIYTSTATGGVWSASNSNATITSGGVATGVSAGTVTISYTATNSCGTVSATKVVTVVAAPVAGTISGPNTVCAGSSITLISSATGGSWSSSNTAVATIGSSSGVLNGVSAGAVNITYSVTNSCGTATATYAVTVNPLGSAGTLAGPSTVCVAGLITLTSTATGGVWSSSNTNATVGSTSGIVTGVNPGIDTITYTVIGSCGLAFATKIITINGLPSAGTISGPASVCVGSVITLSDPVTGGVWTSSNTNATVTGSGIVTGVNAGGVIITYTVSNSCGTATATKTLTVIPLPTSGTLSGPDSVCIGTTITLTSTVAGGTWLSGNSNATVSSTGVVTGVTSGTVPITYTVTNPCGSATAIKIIEVLGPPTAGTLSGPSGVCLGSGITLTPSVAGGSWFASNANATIVAPGVILGAAVGVDTIFYTVTNMCGTDVTSKIVSVNPIPTVAAITGPTAQCIGTTIIKMNTTPGGVWTSSDMSVATVGLSTGIVTGIAAGTINVTYTVTNSFGCPATVTAPDTVFAIPAPGSITGSGNLCLGLASTLSNATPGGTWSSSSPAIATIGTAGDATGVAVGTATISYTVSNLCGIAIITKVVTVNPLPAVAGITGTAHQCVGGTSTLSDATAGGTWSSGDITIATVGSSTGVVTGVSAGTVVMAYIVTSSVGCSASASIVDTVFALPAVAAISGPTIVCVGGSVTLTDATSGGTWSSSDPAVATIGATTGIVTGITAGTFIVTYTFTDVSGCTGIATTVDTVELLPAVPPIAGPTSICVGTTATMTDAATGGTWGTWSSSTPAVATIDPSTGVVSAIAAGTTVITFHFISTSGCSTIVTTTLTVNALPSVAPITGIAEECIGATATLSNATAGGTWSSGDVTIATVGSSTGVVTGVAAGTVNITYTYTNSLGCSGIATIVNTVHPLPTVAPITGLAAECLGFTTTLANATPGGTWSSSSSSIATVDASGVVTGIAGGTAVISYSVPGAFGCVGVATVVNTVNIVPPAAPITGSASVCVGGTGSLANIVTGGVWSSDNTSIATIAASTGVVTGVATGTTMIRYTVINSCGSVMDSMVIAVNPLPTVAPITSLMSTLCTGASTLLSDATPGGTWSSGNPAVATVTSTSGVVTGVSAGTATITYTVTASTGCTNYATYIVTVAASIPAMGVLPVGTATLCNDSTVHMYVNPPATGITYQWMRNGVVIAGATNYDYIADSPGVYSVIVSNGLCSQVLPGTTIMLPPNATIGFNPPNMLFTGSFATYQWYRNGVAIPGATTSVLTFTSNGAYTVKVTDANGCSDSSDAYIVGPSGVAGSPHAADVKVYPNPATSVLHIDAPVAVTVKVMSIDGKLVAEHRNAKDIDVSKLANGLYMIMVYDQDNQLLKIAKFAKTE